jgi:tetratricopeptide (TPR) repeat protein
MSDETARSDAGDGWLRAEDPEVYYMLRAFEGDEEAFRWLGGKSAALYLFTRAITGDRKALKAFEAADDLDLDDLYATIGTCDLPPELGEKHPELFLIFGAIKGDNDALHRLRRKRPSLVHLAEDLRRRYRDDERQDPDQAPAEPSASQQAIPDGAAADMGCLIGELHLSKSDYAKAVEAFTRSIESNPSPDVYEGRARAYRALALEDERRAQELRAASR